MIDVVVQPKNIVFCLPFPVEIAAKRDHCDRYPLNLAVATRVNIDIDGSRIRILIRTRVITDEYGDILEARPPMNSTKKMLFEVAPPRRRMFPANGVAIVASAGSNAASRAPWIWAATTLDAISAVTMALGEKVKVLFAAFTISID